VGSPAGRAGPGRARSSARDVAPCRAMSAAGFGLANLPYGIFRRAGSGEPPRAGVRFEAGVLHLPILTSDGLIDDPEGVFAQPALNAFMASGPATWAATRDRVARLLSGVDAEPELLPLEDVELLPPF